MPANPIPDETNAVRSLLREAREQLGQSLHRALFEYLFPEDTFDSGAPFVTKTYPEILRRIERAKSILDGIPIVEDDGVEALFAGTAERVAGIDLHSIRPSSRIGTALAGIREIVNGRNIYRVNGQYTGLQRASMACAKQFQGSYTSSQGPLGAWGFRLNPDVSGLPNLEELSIGLMQSSRIGNYSASFLGAKDGVRISACPKLARVTVTSWADHIYGLAVGDPYGPIFSGCATGLVFDVSQTGRTAAEVMSVPGYPFGVDKHRGRIVCADGTITFD